MRDEAHVRLVDAHAEGDGGHHHDAFFAQEAVLVLGALRVIHAGVIRQGRNAVLGEELGGLFDLLARQAIDDAGVAAVRALDEIEQLLAAVGLFDDLVADVRAVERWPRTGAPLRAAGGAMISSRVCGSAVAVSAMRGTSRKALVQHRQLEVFGPEIVAPLRDAMRLVDGEQRDLRLLQQTRDSAASSGAPARRRADRARRAARGARSRLLLRRSAWN